jgi:hypothetical protein
VLLGLGAEAELVDMVDDLAEVLAVGDLIFQLPENLADFVFDGVRAGGVGFELLEIGEEALVDEIAEVVAGEGAALEHGLGGAILLEAVEVFQEEEPGVCSE